ncbi:hypothetical protein ELQ87_33495 [Streptomyces griseoviridis]|uniref:Uncharacterized protein n=1 Tax=Streptomyces griseoviridis TaxID=45398 RepID=A0A3S9ZLR9_STRGD|nr:hypothetical protein [Streptomyces griseoviridis]AZS88609.1 hypothetical protein ELQ87_33495 [Streptomyces griseoviridis]QCN84549.1 hypothetical protein DDJ31_05770 [Streptomyces griseoviridis]
MMSVLIIFVVIPGLFVWGMVKVANWYGPGYMARRRDEEIETAMRLGARDAAAADRIGQQIIDEQHGR